MANTTEATTVQGIYRFAFFSISLAALGVQSLQTASAQTDLQQKIATQAASVLKRRAPQNTANPSRGVAAVPEHLAELKLAPGFLVSLAVLDDDDFVGEFRVDEDGKITVPQLGPVRVLGETASEARQQIAGLLVSRGLMKDPQVDLRIVEYVPPEVTIIGEVESPGMFPLLAPMNLQDVLATAGGATVLAGDRIEITSGKNNRKPIIVHYSGQMDTAKLKQTLVNPGDTVQVMRAGVIYVLGAVNRPGGYIMQENGHLSVLEAMSIAGGTAVTASTGSVYIMRKNGDNSTVWFKLPYKKMTRGEASDVPLQKNDVLFVSTSRFKATFTSTQGILASAASASIYAGVIY